MRAGRIIDKRRASKDSPAEGRQSRRKGAQSPMGRTRMNKHIFGLALAGLALLAVPAQAQVAYPKKTVTLVTHSTPGSGTDVYLRQMIKYLGPIMGTNFVVENIKGGSGARAVAKVATSPADGSIFYGATDTYLDMSLLSKPKYGYKDVEAVTNVFFDAEVAYVRADSKFKTLADLVADGKAHPGTQKWGSGTPGSLDREALEELRSMTGIDAAIVPHDGGADAIINVLNGTLDFALGQVPALRGQLDGGKLRLIATLTEQPFTDFPNVTTAKQQGIDLVAVKFRGIVGPKGLPANVLKAWEEGIPKVLANAEFKKWYEHGELMPAFMPHDQYAKYIDQVVKRQQAFFSKFNITEAE
jgi:putative tricarboxylic transport membrane protein